MTHSPDPTPGLELSILVPSYNRQDLVDALLSRLSQQTLASDRFELVLVDDGSDQPVTVDPERWPFAIKLLRQENAGPGAARNLGLEHCRGELTLILNDDAVPAPDLCERHLEAHASTSSRVAVLGTFTFTESSLRSPFTQVLADTDLLFNFPGLRDGELHDWTYFWTCNLSVPTEALRAVGGFDAERFDKAIVEDVELGYRMQLAGYQVLFRADARCEHDHALDAGSYFRRAVNLGIYLARMYKKHGDRSILVSLPDKQLDATFLREIQATAEVLQPQAVKLIEALERFELAQQGQVVPAATQRELGTLIRRLSLVPYSAGLLQELEGHNPQSVLEHGPRAGGLTSIIVVTHDAIDQTRRCLEALRAAAEARHPCELVFVDNGSSDGTAELLAAADDVHLIANATNLGAPHARNQALAVAHGDELVFMDNDVMVTPGWLGRMLYHSQVDGRSGCVGCLSDRAAHGQEVEYGGTSDPGTLKHFADRIAAEHPRSFSPTVMQTSFLMMIRREVLDAIGGFDESFSPWGFEDDDFSLRAHLAGFRNRIARDVFVRHEPYAGTRKAKSHADLLQRNWARFAAKWGLPVGTPYGESKALCEVEPGSVELSDLHLDLEQGERAGASVLAWPDYADHAALAELFSSAAGELLNDDARQLILRVDTALDGPVESVVERLESVYLDVFTQDEDLSISIIDDADPGLATERALQLCASVDSHGSGPERAAWLASTGLPESLNPGS